MTALLLVPLIAFAGFGVDIGSWYARGAQLQRAADAAALAGAALMPDFAAATDKATTTATKNGFTTGGTITVSVTKRGERKIAVRITDSNATRFFSSFFLSNMTITRDAIAEFVLPVPLGSPENYFGNDPATPPPAGQPGLWGNIHGTQTDNTKGDRYGAGCRNTTFCGTLSNAEHRGFYLYQIDVPAGLTFASIEVFDAGLYDRGGNEQFETGDRRYPEAGSGSVTTHWELSARDLTLLDYEDAFVANPTCQSGNGDLTIPEEASPGTYEWKWAPLCYMASPTSGRYWLKVWNTGDGNDANRYSLRVRSSGGSSKPTLSAYRDMSMFNNQLTVNPNFYLAQVDSIHKGKTFIISLYDPGEINVADAKMEVLTPSGSVAASCKVAKYTNPGDTSPYQTVTLAPCAIPTTDSSGSALFQGQLLSIEIGIPSTYSCGTSCWWRIRYNLGPSPSGSPADTTTWSAAIKGDPVHLVNE